MRRAASALAASRSELGSNPTGRDCLPKRVLSDVRSDTSFHRGGFDMICADAILPLRFEVVGFGNTHPFGDTGHCCFQCCKIAQRSESRGRSPFESSVFTTLPARARSHAAPEPSGCKIEVARLGRHHFADPRSPTPRHENHRAIRFLHRFEQASVTPEWVLLPGERPAIPADHP